MKKKKLHTGRRALPFYILFLIFLAVSYNEQTVLPTNTTINFNKTLHNFGESSLKSTLYGIGFEIQTKNPLG